MIKMDERYAIWNNTVKKQLPETWNGNRSASPPKWSIKDEKSDQWKIARSLPDEWGNRNTSPETWHYQESSPSCWEAGLALNNNWKDSGSTPGHPPVSANRTADRSSTAVRQGSGMDFSAITRSGAEKLSEAARKVGGAAKNAAGNAIEYTKSDEVKNKLNSAKDKASTLADKTGSSIKGIKDGAGNFIYKYRPSKNGDTATDNNNAASAEENTYEDTDTAISSYTDEPESEQYNTAEFDNDNIDNSTYEQNYDRKAEEGHNANRRSSASWARSATNNPYYKNNGTYAPVYESPDQVSNYAYTPEKKSPVVFVLLGVIGVLILGVGLLGGMLLMKNKNSIDNNLVTSDVTGDITAQTAPTEDISTTIDNKEAATSAVNMQKIVKEYASGDINKYPQYIKVIKDNLSTVSSSVKFKGLYDVSDIGYSLYDINADNTPELVLSAGNLDIYSIYNGDAVELTPFWGGNMVKGIFIYENGTVGMTAISGNGEGGTTYYRYNGGKELESGDYTSFDLQASVTDYYHDGQLTSKEEFDKIISMLGQQISVSSTPLTNISDIKSYIDKMDSEKYTSYDPSAAGSDFSFSQGKTECTVNTETDDLNLRAKPSANGEVILTIPKGSAVYEYGHNSEWSYVSYNKAGTTYYGYASRKYIASKNSSYTSYDTSAAGNDFSFNQSKNECTVNIESGDLNLRAAPSMNGEVIVLMPKGATVYEYGHNHVWSYISYSTGGTTYYGYANKQYLLNTNEKVQVVSCNKKGTINASNGEVAGFASSYVVDGGPSKLIRKTLDHGWHITAVNYCYSKGILWYELYDTDDNDYYGWVDASFISFY